MGVSIAELFVTVGADVSGASKGLQTLSQQVSRVGRGLTAGLTVPIVAAGAAVFNAGSDFEHSFTQVKRTVDGLDPSQLEELRQSLIDMSTGPAGGLQTASQLAEIAATGGQLGLAGGDIKDFTSLVARLSAATNLPSGEIAEDIGRSINVMNLASTDYEAFGSVITDLGNKFGGTERDIFEFSRRLGGVLSALGVKPAQIEALGAALSAAGVEPEAGATAINQFFIEMVNSLNKTAGASDETKQKLQNLKDSVTDLSNNLEVAVLRQKEFGRNTLPSVVKANQIAIDKYKRELGQASTGLDTLSKKSTEGEISISGMAKVAGVSEDAFRTLVKTDPARAFASFVAGLQNIQKTGGAPAVTKTLEELGITGDRQRSTLLDLANSVQNVTTALDIADAAWKDPVALANENAKVFEDAQNRITLAVNKGTAEQIKAYDKQRGAVQQVLDQIDNDVIPTFSKLLGMIPTLTTDQIKFGAALAALGPALIILGTILSGIAGLLGILGSPVVLGVAATLIGVALAIDQIANHWDTFKESLNKVPQLAGVVGIIDFFKANGEQIKNILSTIIGYVRTFDGDFNSVLGAAFVYAGTIFSAFGDFLHKFFDNVILPTLLRFSAWVNEHVIGAFIGILEFLKTMGVANLPGGAGIGATIDQLKAQQATAATAAGGGGVNVTINNPQVTSQELLDQLARQVSQAVTTAMVSAERVANLDLPVQRVPGQPF